jgi:putative DNA primase/helicase
LDWRANGLGTPDIVTKATDEYREEMDALAPFFEDCCVIDKEGRCNITDLWSAYKTWRDQNEDNTFETPNKFNHSVGGHEAIKRDKSNGAKIWRGIRLKGLFDEKQPLENTS